MSTQKQTLQSPERNGKQAAATGYAAKPLWLTFLRRYDLPTVAALFVALTIWISWPLPRLFGTALAGQDSDVPINLWANWWTGLAMSGQVSLWQTSYLFFPVGADLTFHSFSHFNSVLALLLQPMLGQIPAYNSIILLNYVLSGIAMYQLARHLTGSRLAALLAGIVFAFNSHNQYQSAHPVLLSIWCLPWATLSFLRINEGKGYRSVLALALMIILTTATSTLLLIMLVLWLIGLTFYVWIDPARHRPHWTGLFLAATGGGLGSLPLLWPLINAYLLADNRNFLISSEEVLYIADMLSPLIPHWYVWLVRGLYLGLVPLILLIGARHRWRFSRLWFALFALAYLFAVGPFPIVAGTQLDIEFPWSHLIVPLLRNPYRLNIYLSLALAMLVAHGWLALVEGSFSKQKQWHLAFAVTAILILAEYGWPTFPVTQIEVSSFYTDYLESVPDEVALAVVPANRSIGKTYMYLQTYHQHPITGGAVSRRDEKIFAYQQNNPLLSAALAEGDIQAVQENSVLGLSELAAAGVGYIVIHKGYLDEAELLVWRSTLGDQPIFEDEGLIVYTTRGRP